MFARIVLLVFGLLLLCSHEVFGADRNMIKQSQFILDRLGYHVGVADGVIGEKTRAAIRAFQKQNELKETGELNEETRNMLLLKSDTVFQGSAPEAVSTDCNNMVLAMNKMLCAEMARKFGVDINSFECRGGNFGFYDDVWSPEILNLKKIEQKGGTIKFQGYKFDARNIPVLRRGKIKPLSYEDVIIVDSLECKRGDVIYKYKYGTWWPKGEKG